MQHCYSHVAVNNGPLLKNPSPSTISCAHLHPKKGWECILCHCCIEFGTSYCWNKISWLKRKVSWTKGYYNLLKILCKMFYFTCFENMTRIATSEAECIKDIGLTQSGPWFTPEKETKTLHTLLVCVHHFLELSDQITRTWWAHM